jgi:hypothetical protein
LRLHNSFSVAMAACTLILAGCEGPRLGGGLSSHKRQQQVYYEEPEGPIEKPQSSVTVVERVNENSLAMNFMLRGGGVTAKGEYVEGGKSEAYELTGTLLYRKPRYLYLKLQHSLGGKMEIGSNSQEFWVWKRIGKDRYYYGSQQSVDEQQDLDIPLRPTDLVEVLGLGALPAESVEATNFSVKENRYEIRVMGRSSGGKTYNSKLIRVDRRAPHLVREMEYYNPNGQPRVVAHLSRYEAVDGSNVQAPRRILIEWPDRGGHMNLEFASMQRFDSARAEGLFNSPVQLGRDVGRMERVDVPTQASGR